MRFSGLLVSNLASSAAEVRDVLILPDGTKTATDISHQSLGVICTVHT
jgi:hypothetical protein